MRILMLGWEFPPSISGGLGTACQGLTRALDRHGHDVLFILPRGVRAPAEHLQMLSEDDRGKPRPPRPARPAFERVPANEPGASLQAPYAGFDQSIPGEAIAREILLGKRREVHAGAPRPGAPAAPVSGQPVASAYGGDPALSAADYAKMVVALARDESFDIIHAHDWPTFTAGIALARATDRPLIAHIHSTELDRAAGNPDRAIYDLERRGLFAADRVIAVSAFTKDVLVRQYGAGPAKIDIIYNGIDREEAQPPAHARIEQRDKIVLFLGRITQQKGPEYFIAAARRVLERYNDVKFVIAGSGDLALAMMDLARAAGIEDKVLFTGFLRGPDVESIFKLADCFVMPSIAEPFGLAALEAMNHGVPVIISKQSGVSEVLEHALKVNFWDTQDLADKILALLRRPALGETLREHAPLQLRRLTWDTAAEACVRTYTRAISERGGLPAAH
jgi:glycogen synthase